MAILCESIQNLASCEGMSSQICQRNLQGHWVHVTTDGKVYLGSFIGPDHMKDVFVQGKVDSWLTELEELPPLPSPNPMPPFVPSPMGW